MNSVSQIFIFMMLAVIELLIIFLTFSRLKQFLVGLATGQLFHNSVVPFRFLSLPKEKLRKQSKISNTSKQKSVVEQARWNYTDSP